MCLNWICTQQSDISQAWERKQVQVCAKFINLLDDLVIRERKILDAWSSSFFYTNEAAVWANAPNADCPKCCVRESCCHVSLGAHSLLQSVLTPKPTRSLVIKVGTLPTVRKLSALSGCTGFAQSGFASWSLRILHSVFQRAAVCTKKWTAPSPAWHLCHHLTAQFQWIYTNF